MKMLAFFKKNTRRWKKILLVFLLVVLVFLSVFSAVIATERGSRWIVAKAAAMSGAKITGMHGSLLLGLDATSVDYSAADVSVHLENLSFRWQPFALFYTTLSVQSLAADNIRIHLPTAKPDAQPKKFSWPDLGLPLRVELDNLAVHHIEIEQADQTYSIDAISGALVLGKFHMQATDLSVTAPQYKVLVNGSAAVHYPYKSSLTIKWQFNEITATQEAALPEKATPFVYKGEGTITGDITRLRIQHKLQQPLSIITQAKIAPAINDRKHKPHAEIINDWNDQLLTKELKQQLDPTGNLSFFQGLNSTQGHLQLQGWLDTYQLGGRLTATTDDASFAAEIKAQAKNTRDSLGKFTGASMHLDELRITTAPPAPVAAQTLAQQIAKVPALLPEPAVTALKKQKDASDALKSYLLLTGDLQLLPSVQWKLSLAGEHINLGQFLAEWPSNLSLQINSQGEIAQGKLSRLDVAPLDVKGVLRSYSLLAQGELHFDGNHWQTPGLQASIGDNHLSLKGQASDQLALEWKLTAPALHQLDPSMHGSITSSGALSGDIDNPRLQIIAQANQISFGSYAANNLLIKLNPLAPSEQYDLQLDATDVEVQGQLLSHVSAKGQGTIALHQITGQLQSTSYGRLNFGLTSGWKNQQWHGQWREFKLDAPKLPQWYMVSSTAMQIDSNRADLGKLCLSTANELPSQMETATASHNLQETPNLCIAAAWDNTKGTSADISIKAAPLSAMRAWFKPEVNLAGVIEGDGSLRIPKAAPMTLDAKLQTRNAKLLYQFQGGKVETYPLEKGTVNITLKNNQLVAAALLDWASYGKVNADAKYSLKDKKIQAKANVELSNLSPLQGLLPFLNNVQGSASGNVTWLGSLDKPEITGNFSLVNGSANLPKLGLELKNISLQITSPSINSAHVEGKITSGDGTLVTQGDFVNLGAPDWHWQANVFGADIRIITQTQLSANISPNLKLHADANSIELTGSTEIPWARANVKSLPESATRVSHDVVIVEKDKLADASIGKKSIPFHTNVILYFGDDVRFKGFGLDTRLSGKAKVIKEENRQLFTTGFVAVDRGIYKAYGQELTIERGRLIFQGPYDNPGLDIRAVRNISETESAGLDIGGTLQHPRSTVFAIPAKSDSEAMALLLTGKSLTQSSKDDAYAILGAIGKLGLSQGDSTSADVIHKVGLDEVTVKADKGLEQSQLWLGQNLTPRLFVHYIVGIFDQAFSLGLTYKISDKIQVEAVSGKTQSVDIIYKIER